MVTIKKADARTARPAAIAFVLALTGALISGCAGTGYDSIYNKPSGKILVMSKGDWQDFKAYLGKIGSTHDGAFAVAVYDGKSDGWTSSSCGYDVCYGGGNSSGQAMKMCREHGVECVLFATDDRILVNYRIEGEDSPAP